MYFQTKSGINQRKGEKYEKNDWEVCQLGYPDGFVPSRGSLKSWKTWEKVHLNLQMW